MAVCEEKGTVEAPADRAGERRRLDAYRMVAAPAVKRLIQDEYWIPRQDSLWRLRSSRSNNSHHTERFCRGTSIPVSASRRDAKPPAASLFPSKACREFPLSRPFRQGRRYAESSDTLHFFFGRTAICMASIWSISGYVRPALSRSFAQENGEQFVPRVCEGIDDRHAAPGKSLLHVF